MRFILFLPVVLLFSCENKKEKIATRLQAIEKEMKQVKAFYYKKSDSLQMANKADTNSAKLNEEFSLLEKKKNLELLKLEKEYYSLEKRLKRY